MTKHCIANKGNEDLEFLVISEPKSHGDRQFFDAEVVLVEQRGNQKLENRKKKWECLESRTARRTFITRSITKGIPLTVSMGITGHSRIETLTRYMDKYTPTNGYRELLEE